ncbi:MAG: S41 family peptidase [Syntrophomonadaceae bacterium]|nr:S41 family peptidase [Syntrophomonadaceae bacterium]
MFFTSLGVLCTVGVIFLLVVNPLGLGTLLSVVGLINSQSLYQISPQQMLGGATAGVVEALDDPYSSYLDTQSWQELKIRLEAKFGGIGVYVFQDNEGRIQLYSPIKGTPAYEEGIQHGDILTKINGKSTMNMSQDDAVTLMRGDPGTQVKLNVYRESDNKEYEFEIVREIINVPSVEEEVLDGGIAYIRLSQFHAQSSREMSDSLNRLLQDEGIQGLVLDLRNNGGGEFEAAIDIASIFLSEGEEVVSSADAQGNRKVYRATAGKTNIPLVVLVNQDSASASEILAAALQDNSRAVLVGTTTYGKGLVQTVFPLRDGGALKLTTQKYYTPNGTDINEIGIVPDYFVEQNPNGEDVQLNKAIELLKEKL